MSDIKNFSIEELRAEVARREMEKRRPPKVKSDINWLPLIDYVTSSINQIAAEDPDERSEPKDFEHWIFESVMEAIYGKDIWKWWNEQF